jgi:hypothetical protein
MSCPYKNLAGEPGKGIHETRFLGLSVVDIVGTYILFAIPSARFLGGNVWIHFAIWLVIGEIFHYAFGTQTAVLTMLGITACSHTS